MRIRLKSYGMLVSALTASAAFPMSGQIIHHDGPLPSFEVATIKPWKPALRPINAPKPAKLDPGQHSPQKQANHVHFIGQIGLLIMEAYNLPVGSENRILKGPGWVESEGDRYEIDAKIEPSMFAAMQQLSAEQQHEQVQLLEQSLLADRFGLKVHVMIQGETPVYALVVAPGGPKLAPAKEGEHTELSLLKNEITAKAVTLGDFASSPLWTPIGKRYVRDETGLVGAYDFSLKWRSDSLDVQTDENSKDLPPLFDAIREQLGLAVVDSKAPLEVIVIDRIDRPTQN